MISLFMLPASPQLVKTGPAAALGRKRARRNRLTALGVLLLHAVLLGLFWNGQPSRLQLSAPPSRLIEISVLAPPVTGLQPPARQPLSHPTPAASKAPAAPAVSRQPRSKAAPQTPAPAPTFSKPEATASEAVAASSQASAQAGEAVSSPVQRAAQPSNSAPPRIELPDSDAAYLDNPRPAYPPMSRRLGEKGRVLMRVWVEADGRPGQVLIKNSSGFERLDRAAQQTVQHWRFVPGKRAGQTEAMWAEVPLQFVLE